MKINLELTGDQLTYLAILVGRIDGKTFTALGKLRDFNLDEDAYTLTFINKQGSELWNMLSAQLRVVLKNRPIQVILNSEYTAEVSKEGVKVGCQVFPLEKLEELAAAARKVKAGQ